MTEISLMQVLVFLGLVVAVLVLLGNLFTAVFQDWFIFIPERLKPGFKFTFTKAFEEVQITTPHRGSVNGLWFRQAGSKGVIFYHHGNKGSLKRWGHYAPGFLKKGYDYFVYDYRGFGKSKGIRNEKTMYGDALALYDFLAEHYSPDQIIVYGRSMGSAPAIKVAAERHCHKLVLETPFSSMVNLFFIYYPFLPKLFRFKYALRSDNLLSKVRCPVLIIQGDKDRIVPHKCAEQLLPHLKKEDQYLLIPDGRHGNLAHFEEYDKALDSYLST